MKIDDYTYMDRQSPQHAVKTRLLVNGKIEGGQKKQIRKLNGYKDVVTVRSINGETFDMVMTNVCKVVLKGYTSTPMFVGIYNNSLYYIYEGSSYWLKIEWRGDDSPNFPEVRFYYDRGRLVISGGPNGTEAILKYVDRQIADENGYFQDLQEFTGLWFGPSDTPVYNPQTYLTVSGSLVADKPYYLDCGSTYFLMGAYVMDDGEIGMPSSESVLTVYKGTDDITSADSFYANFIISVDFASLDKRVIAIQYYVASTAQGFDKIAFLEGDEGAWGIRPKKPVVMRGTSGETQIERLKWRALKRIYINKPNIVYAGSGRAGLADADKIRYRAADASAGWFPTSSIEGKFKIRYKKVTETEWEDSTSILTVTPNSTDNYVDLILSEEVFDLGEYYNFEIYSPWVSVSSTIYQSRMILRYDGYTSESVAAINELGSPIEAVQPWAVIEEYYPQASFFAIQDRRAFRLDCTTDERYRNMLIWSELNTIRTTPNKNNVLLNTAPEDTAKGLESIDGGLYALFKRSCHYIRMTGEPIEYDREEGVVNEGCVSKRSVLSVNGVCYYLSPSGFKAFDRGIKDISTPFIRTMCLDLIKYCDGVGKLDEIYVGYSQAQNMVVWAFPYSNEQIESIYVRLLGYDVINGGWTIIESDKEFYGLFNGDNNELYATSWTVIHELFSDDPDESNRLIWQSGVITPDMAETVLRRLRASYKGVITIKAYVNDESTEVIDMTLPENASYGLCKPRSIGVRGNEVQIWVESESSIDEQILGPLELIGKENVAR